MIVICNKESKTVAQIYTESQWLDIDEDDFQDSSLLSIYRIPNKGTMRIIEDLADNASYWTIDKIKSISKETIKE